MQCQLFEYIETLQYLQLTPTIQIRCNIILFQYNQNHTFYRGMCVWGGGYHKLQEDSETRFTTEINSCL